MTKEELQERIGLEAGEAKSWDELSHDDKAYVVRVLKENGFKNASEAVEELDFNYESASFGGFWLAVGKDDADNMQSFFD